MWYFIAFVVIYVLYKFMRSVSEDNHEAAVNPVQNRFAHVYKRINEAAFNGTASLDKIDQNRVTLFKSGANQMVIFTYMMKSLEVTWKYKYMQKEVVYNETFHNVDNISVYDQEKLAKRMIDQMRSRVDGHVQQVESGASHAERSAVLGLNNNNPLGMNLDEKLSVFILMMSMADADNEVDTSEMTVVNSARILFDITDENLIRMKAHINSANYDLSDAFKAFGKMEKKKRDLVLVTLNDIAGADSFIHAKEVEFMDLVAARCGYSRQEAAQVIDKYQKIMAMMVG